MENFFISKIIPIVTFICAVAVIIGLLSDFFMDTLSAWQSRRRSKNGAHHVVLLLSEAHYDRLQGLMNRLDVKSGDRMIANTIQLYHEIEQIVKDQTNELHLIKNGEPTRILGIYQDGDIELEDLSPASINKSFEGLQRAIEAHDLGSAYPGVLECKDSFTPLKESATPLSSGVGNRWNALLHDLDDDAFE